MPTWGKLVCQKNCKKKIADVLYGWSLTLVDSWAVIHPSVLLMSEATTKLVGLGRSESVVLDQKLIWLRLFGTGSVNSVREGRRLSPSVHKDPFCQDLVCSSTNDHIWIDLYKMIHYGVTFCCRLLLFQPHVTVKEKRVFISFSKPNLIILVDAKKKCKAWSIQSLKPPLKSVCFY